MWLLVAKKRLLQLTHLPCDLWWFAETPFQDWGLGVCPPPISLLPSVRSGCFKTPPMPVMPPERERAVYDFPSDCHKSKAKTPTSGRAGSGSGTLVAVCAVGGLQERCTNSPRPQRGPGSCLPLPSRCVPGACGCSDYPICKLQSRLSASASEIRDLYLCLLPREPGRPELNLVQTLWHHGADYWGNLFLCWEHCEEGSDDFQLRKKKKKEKREHTTTTTVVSSIRMVGGKSGTSLRCHRLLQTVTRGEFLGGVGPMCFFSCPLVM